MQPQTAPLLLTLLAATLAPAATNPPLAPGDPLPALTGRRVTLPAASQGHVTLLLLGFSYDSRFAVEAFTKRFRADFPAASNTSPNAAPNATPAATPTFYEIPMIGGFGRLGKWFIDSGMRRGTPPADHTHVITIYGGTDPWKQRLRVSDPTHAYLILLDAAGRIAWLHHGPFDAAAARTLATETRRLLPKPPAP